MTFNRLDLPRLDQFERARQPDSEIVLSSGMIHLGVGVLELAYGAGGSVELDPDHEDAKRYPNPKRPEDTPPPQDQPPAPPRWI